jgi:hypothetical protein
VTDSQPTLTQRRDAELAALEAAARAALSDGADVVTVDAAALLGALATLDAYKDMAGLGARLPRDRRAMCVRCHEAWLVAPSVWIVTAETPIDCEHTTE